MDQKHSMMYPSLSGRGGGGSGVGASSSQRNNDVPTEAPPSYDMAMAHEPTSTQPQLPTAPSPTTPVGAQDIRQYPLPASSSPMVTANLESYSTNVNRMNRGLPPVVVDQPGLEPLKLGPHPSKVTCPECGQSRRTRVHYTPNRKTHIFALVLCLVGWCCCACSVPYCMSSCKTGHHYCAKCNRFLGTYNQNDF